MRELLSVMLLACISAPAYAQGMCSADKGTGSSDCRDRCRDVCRSEPKCEANCIDRCRDVPNDCRSSSNAQFCTNVGPISWCVPLTGTGSVSISGQAGPVCLSVGIIDQKGTVEGCVTACGSIGVGVVNTRSAGVCINSKGTVSATASGGGGYGVAAGAFKASKTVEFTVQRELRNIGAKGASGSPSARAGNNGANPSKSKAAAISVQAKK